MGFIRGGEELALGSLFSSKRRLRVLIDPVQDLSVRDQFKMASFRKIE